MDKLISRQAAIDVLENNRFPGARYVDTGIKIAIRLIKNLPLAEPKIIRCKDCKHRPSGTGVNHDLEFPHDDYKCPCQCEDFWYSWMPDDDWFCANGERREDG